MQTGHSPHTFATAEALLAEGHSALARVRHQLLHAVWQRRTDGIRELLDEVLAVAQEHFREEEALLEHLGLPGTAGHRRQHREFLNRVLLYESAYLARDLDLDEAAAFVVGWLIRHERQESSIVQQHRRRGHASLGPRNGTKRSSR